MRPTPSQTSPGGAGGVEIRDITGHLTHVDHVVLATHADQALSLLTDPSDEEVTTLKEFAYSRNITVLHTDSSVLPDAAQARASWNYRMTSCDRPGQRAVVTYWMNRLQGHPAAQDFLVTLNDRERLDPESIVATMQYEHPTYTPEAVRAQSRLSSLATDRTVYALLPTTSGDSTKTGAAPAWRRHDTSEWPG